MPLLRGVEGEDDVRLSTFVSLQTVSKPTMVYLVSAESSKLVNTCCKDDNCLSDICPALNAMKSVKASVSNPSVLSAGRDPVEVNVSGGGGFVALRWLLHSLHQSHIGESIDRAVSKGDSPPDSEPAAYGPRILGIHERIAPH